MSGDQVQNTSELKYRLEWSLIEFISCHPLFHPCELCTAHHVFVVFDMPVASASAASNQWRDRAPFEAMSYYWKDRDVNKGSLRLPRNKKPVLTVHSPKPRLPKRRRR